MTTRNPIAYPSLLVWDFLRLVAYVISKTFWFIRFEGRENIPPVSAGGFLIAANHQSYVDPVWIILPMRRRIRFMTVESAIEWPVIGRLIAYLGSFPVPSEGGSFQGMREALRTLRDGAVLTVFPEGARAFADGKMLDFKTGAVKIAMQADVPIMPVTIKGAHRIWPRGQKYPNIFRRVTITYHPIMNVDKRPDGEKEQLAETTERLRLVIGEAIVSEESAV